MKKMLPVLLLVLGACAQPEVPTDRFYRLDVALPETRLAKPALAGTLEVDRFVADGLTAGRPIVYSESGRPREVLEYHYHFWTEPPTIMLRDQLVTYLRAAKVADIVVTPKHRVEPDYELSGKIKRLEQIKGTPPRAVVELELALKRSADGQILLLDTYRIEAEAKSGTVGAAVDALNSALGLIYARFTNDISGL
jgi:ABC-type uncharacterized transport system auxiliary subunit